MENEILTCSQDKQVKVNSIFELFSNISKFWDVNQPKTYKDLLQVGAPVIHAVYTVKKKF
jgi:hypothetical protein